MNAKKRKRILWRWEVHTIAILEREMRSDGRAQEAGGKAGGEKTRAKEAMGYAKAGTQNWRNEKGTVSVLGGRDG